MPKVLGLNLVGVLAASVAFYLVGFLWYGVIFADMWMAAKGISETDAQAEGGAIYMIGGFLITILQVVGIGLAMKWKGAASMGAAAVTALILWICFALPFSTYQYFYSVAHDPTLMMIDACHLLCGWVVAAIVLSLFK